MPRHLAVTMHTVPHGQQRYNTAGDWRVHDDEFASCAGVDPGDPSRVTTVTTIRVTVSDLGDEKMEAAVMLHELVEAFLCRWRGVREEDVMAFDLAHPEHADPGLLPAAPYHREHMAADALERIFCQLAGISWPEYEAAIEALG